MSAQWTVQIEESQVKGYYFTAELLIQKITGRQITFYRCKDH